MEKEKKLVSLSMLILFLALTVIYSLLYQVRGKLLFAPLSELGSGNQQQTLQQVKLPQPETSLGEHQLLELELVPPVQTGTHEGEGHSDTSIGNDAIQMEQRGEQTASSGTRLAFEGENPVLLSGTQLYFGVVEGIDLLGLEPDYLLKDKKGFYYAKFQEEPDLKQIVQDLGGNIYTMTSEADLLRNQLFGDKISFINLPEYKNKLVLMMLSIDEQFRVLQIPYKNYHHAKKYLKRLFIH